MLDKVSIAHWNQGTGWGLERDVLRNYSNSWENGHSGTRVGQWQSSGNYLSGIKRITKSGKGLEQRGKWQEI